MSLAAILVAIAVGAYVTLSPKNISASRDPNAPLPEEIVQCNQKAAGESEIYLAGGCFWGTELLMSNVDGVTSTEVGYANGATKNPGYREVCAGAGHAEAVHVIYKPDKISLPDLLEIYYRSIDPTSLNRQGNDKGIQYRTGIYFSDPNDAATVEQSLQELQNNFSKPVIFTAPKKIINATWKKIPTAIVTCRAFWLTSNARARLPKLSATKTFHATKSTASRPPRLLQT